MVSIKTAGIACPLHLDGGWAGQRDARPKGGAIHGLSPWQNPFFHASGPTQGWLVGLDGAHIGEDFRLLPGANLVGSSFRAHIALTAPGVSAKHLLVFCEDGAAVMVTDVSGKQSGRLNGQPLTNQMSLVDGDELQLGAQRLQFRAAFCATPHYRPQYRPRPAVAQMLRAPPRTFITGWLVAAGGPYSGSDFRLVNGRNEVGASEGLAVSLLGAALKPLHAVLHCGDGHCYVEAASQDADVAVNGEPLVGNRELFDSDRLHLGQLSFYLKWF